MSSDTPNSTPGGPSAAPTTATASFADLIPRVSGDNVYLGTIEVTNRRGAAIAVTSNANGNATMATNTSATTGADATLKAEYGNTAPYNLGEIQANVEALSPQLRAKVDDRPTLTTLRSENKNVDNLYIKIGNLRKTRNLEIPESFDGRAIWGPKMLGDVVNQGSCGSCYAIATTNALAARFNINSGGQLSVELSPTKMVICLADQAKQFKQYVYPNQPPGACLGNSLINAARYLYEIGTVSTDCVPYLSELSNYSNFTEIPTCANTTGKLFDLCSGQYTDESTGYEVGKPARYYKALTFHGLDANEERLRDNIYKWGPICSSMKMYSEFYTYDAKNEIYEWDGVSPQVGGHAVMMVGWGKDALTGKPYWIIKNSWGDQWGDGGYFRILRGVNMCEIESNCIGFVADFWYPFGYQIRNFDLFRVDKILADEREQIGGKAVEGVSAGGIDLGLGFTKRILVDFPWSAFTDQPPIHLENLPDWAGYVAGRDVIMNNHMYEDEIQTVVYAFVAVIVLYVAYKVYRASKK